MLENNQERAMPNSPENYPFFTYLWVVGISALGALARFAQKYNDGTIPNPSVSRLAAEITISAFIGVVTFWLCEWAKIDGLLSAAVIAVSAHMGTPALVLLERQLMRDWFKRG